MRAADEYRWSFAPAGMHQIMTSAHPKVTDRENVKLFSCDVARNGRQPD
jgi:hypothetical protein